MSNIYSKQNRCSCGKIICNKAKKCQKCKHVGKRNPNYKNGRYIKVNIVCIDCGKILSKQPKAKRCSLCSKLGKNNPNWQGGKSFEPYTPEFTYELKEKIRKRDKYRCKICHLHQKEHLQLFKDKLYIHHIDYNKKNCNKENLTSLCIPCHAKTNYNRLYWLEYFKNRSITKESA